LSIALGNNSRLYRGGDEGATEETDVSQLVHRFMQDTSGATSIEYAAIASMLSIVIVSAVLGLGTKVKALFTSVSVALG
jgi:pilus assembly protein Flp/PilA